MDDKTKELVEKLRAFSTTELCDGAGFAYNTMDADVKPMVTTKKIVGPAVTVKVPIGEGQIITKAIEQLQPGDVLVIAGGGNTRSAYWGDLRSYCAKFQKAEGVVIDGAFRDIEGCEAIGFPIYAKGIVPGTSGKSGAGEINVPISCAGACVNPGDLIVGDRNGVCVIKPEDAERIMEGARRQIEAEQFTIAEMERTGVCLPRVIRPTVAEPDKK